jgi:hypothetical protein
MRGFNTTYDYVVEAGWEVIRDCLGLLFRTLVRILTFPLFIPGAIKWIYRAKELGHNWLWNFGVEDK